MADRQLDAIRAQLAAGDARGARVAADAAIASRRVSVAERAAALMLRSRAHELLRDLPSAIADMERAIALAPGNARAHNELGILRADAGDREGAIAAFVRATTLDPAYARGWNNLGTALLDAGRYADAEAALLRATQADARYALAWANLGLARRNRGHDDASVAALEQALALDARQLVALSALAGLQRAQGRLDEAAKLYERALSIDPADAVVWLNFAGTLAERDELDAARRAYAEAEARDPQLLRALVARHLSLPMIPASARAIADLRAGFARGLEELAGELSRRVAGMPAERVLDELRWTNFLLAYHGEDDLRLQQAYGRIVVGAIGAAQPAWVAKLPRRARSTRRLRVAFCSSFLRDGTVGRYFERWITDLPRDRFEVVVYHLYPGRDALTSRIEARADAFRDCPRLRPSQIAAAIRADEPDVLVYPELGMDATTFALGALRLAPLQCAAWGHPVTTGLATIDTFFSAADMEPEDGQAHYTEHLVLLPGIGTHYDPVAVPAPASRESLGLPADVPLFLCPQSLFKLMPEDDALLADVLAAVPDARLVMFEGRHPAWAARLTERLAAACRLVGVDLGNRLILLAQRRHDQYLQINLACDAMLDTLRWSGGNTSLDAIACGLPIVTLPGRFMRARQSAAMLRQAGASSLVARSRDEYVAIATRLVHDRTWRNGQSTVLVAGAARLFGVAEPVRAFADWLDAHG